MKSMKIFVITLMSILLFSCAAASSTGSRTKGNKNYRQYMTYAKDLAKSYDWKEAAEQMENSLDLHETGEGYYLAGLYYIKASINSDNDFTAKSLYKKGRKYLKISANDFGYKPAEKTLEDIKNLKTYK